MVIPRETDKEIDGRLFKNLMWFNRFIEKLNRSQLVCKQIIISYRY